MVCHTELEATIILNKGFWLLIHKLEKYKKKQLEGIWCSRCTTPHMLNHGTTLKHGVSCMPQSFLSPWKMHLTLIKWDVGWERRN
jgi:hypothetical protein